MFEIHLFSRKSGVKVLVSVRNSFIQLLDKSVLYNKMKYLWFAVVIAFLALLSLANVEGRSAVDFYNDNSGFLKRAVTKRETYTDAL